MTKGRNFLVKFVDIQVEEKKCLAHFCEIKNCAITRGVQTTERGLYVFLFYVFIYFETERDQDFGKKIRHNRE
jgi:hypothetical protein